MAALFPFFLLQKPESPPCRVLNPLLACEAAAIVPYGFGISLVGRCRLVGWLCAVCGQACEKGIRNSPIRRREGYNNSNARTLLLPAVLAFGSVVGINREYLTPAKKDGRKDELLPFFFAHTPHLDAQSGRIRGR